MLNNAIADAVARQLCIRLNGQAFTTVSKRDMANMLREASGNPGARLTKARAKRLESSLRLNGIIAYPELEDTNAADNIRLYHAGTVAAEVAHAILYPSEDADKKLAVLTQKAKGTWTWKQRLITGTFAPSPATTSR